MNKKRTELTVTAACRAHRSDKIDVSTRSHVARLLESEGHKRVEGFVFEQIFKDTLHNTFESSALSEGWYFQFDSKDEPSHWFQLVFGTTLSPTDHFVSEWLRENGASVYRVYFSADSNTFEGHKIMASSDVVETMPLASLMHEVTGREAVQPRNYEHINMARQHSAISQIKGRLSDQQMLELGASRIFVNCYLYPWFGKQPMDIDACIVSEGSVIMIEFKRKYPARDLTFGLDEQPHGKLCDWLAEKDGDFAHVILVSPVWDANVSPFHLLGHESDSAPFACWLGAFLDDRSFISGHHSTRGRDSGMLGGHRQQRKLPVGSFVELGTGMMPDSENFAAFFMGNQQLEQATEAHLIQLRDSVRT